MRHPNSNQHLYGCTVATMESLGSMAASLHQRGIRTVILSKHPASGRASKALQAQVAQGAQ
jgi:hypothetical protein